MSVSGGPLVRKSIEVDGVEAAVFEGGTAGRPPLLLMHGLGPGAAVGSAFASIIDELCRQFHVFATDLIGFGGSGRKPAPPYFDFPLWVKQARALVARMPGNSIGVFGHSASGAVALRLAASEPKVRAVLTTATAGTRFAVNDDLRRLWTFPRTRAELDLAMRSLLHDPACVPPGILDLRWSTLQAAGYREYFESMFSGDLQRLADSWIIPDEELRRIRVPYTLVHGREDRPCPAEATSIELSRKIPNATLVVLPDCGHAPATEHPRAVCAAVQWAFRDLVNA